VSDQRLRVLHLIKCLDRGGAEELVAAIVTSPDVSLCSYEVAFVRSSMRSLVGRIEDAGVRVHDLGASRDLDLTWLVRLRRLLSDGRYDVLHTHLPYSAGMSRLVAHTLPPGRRPLIVTTEHSYWPRNGRVTRLLSAATARLDDVSIAVSASTRAGMPTRVQARTHVVLHGIDTDRLLESATDHRETRQRMGVPPSHQLVVTVANLRPQKGYQTLLAAAALLVTMGRPVTFLAAGHGPLEPELTTERDRLGLGQRFRFLGQRDDVASLVAASDVFVLASDWECMPVAVMEALVLGTPVVATAVGELTSILRNGINAMVVRTGDPAALAESLDRLLRDPELRQQLATEGARTGAQFDVRRARREVENMYVAALRPS
jgi:glycosyltransferase involved in cell wall biosynthesis